MYPLFWIACILATCIVLLIIWHAIYQTKIEQVCELWSFVCLDQIV